MGRTAVLLVLTVGISQISHALERNEKLVNDPYKIAWDNLDGEASGLTRFFLDINDDGRPDLFVTGTSLVGNAGAPFHVFISGSKGYRELGEVFLDNGSFQLLELKHKGVRDIKVCSHLSASECVLRTFIYNGKNYEKKSERTISGEKFKNEISTPTLVKFEKSGKPLSWK